MTDIAIIGAGAMGSAFGQRLTENGTDVLAFLDGRSEASRERARAAGMRAVDLDMLLSAEIVLSIVPPGEAVSVATDVAENARRQASKTVFIDCNAIAPKTMEKVAACFEGSAVTVLDGSIIGGPPKPGTTGPRLYISGDNDKRSALLDGRGLDIRHMAGPLGAASALKMCYAGITKGLVGLGTAMTLAAIESGSDQSFKAEIEESVPDLTARLKKGIPDMYPKAYRWVAEMEEIADFLGDDDPASLIYRGMAGLYRRMADDAAGDRKAIADLDRLLGS